MAMHRKLGQNARALLNPDYYPDRKYTGALDNV